MPEQSKATAPYLAPEWSLERLTPRRCFPGANGLRWSPDGRLYVAQCMASRISALDVDTGATETISGPEDPILGPDDLAFDSRGCLFVTEFMDARVSVIESRAAPRVLRGDLPGANGITFYQDRLFVDECRPNGRLLELDLAGSEPREILRDLPLPNALAAGPDGMLYFPLIGANEIWRVHPDGGKPERVVGDLGRPNAVKFDSSGHILSTQSRTGEILRINPQSGKRRLVAALEPGLDNLEAVGDRIFVSHMADGRITEILPDGALRPITPPGLTGPFGLTVSADDAVYAADHLSFHRLGNDGPLLRLSNAFDPNFPVGMRDVACLSADTFVVTTWSGQVVAYAPSAKTANLLAENLSQPYGVAIAGAGVLVVERGAGRVLYVAGGSCDVIASGLDDPVGIATAPDGSILVTEAGRGRIIRIEGPRVTTVADDLDAPQGLAAYGDAVYAVEAGRNAVVAIERGKGTRVLAAGLPCGMSPGGFARMMKGAPPFSGPFGPFCGLASAPDGSLYVSGDLEGTILRLGPDTPAGKGAHRPIRYRSYTRATSSPYSRC